MLFRCLAIWCVCVFFSVCCTFSICVSVYVVDIGNVFSLADITIMTCAICTVLHNTRGTSQS